MGLDQAENMVRTADSSPSISISARVRATTIKASVRDGIETKGAR
jgi:hypothetical protein